MTKICVFNLKGFLQVVNRCKGSIHLLHCDGTKEDINKQYQAQELLEQEHKNNHHSLSLCLEIPNSTDYMNIVLFSLGDF